MDFNKNDLEFKVWDYWFISPIKYFMIVEYINTDDKYTLYLIEGSFHGK